MLHFVNDWLKGAFGELLVDFLHVLVLGLTRVVTDHLPDLHNLFTDLVYLRLEGQFSLLVGFFLGLVSGSGFLGFLHGFESLLVQSIPYIGTTLVILLLLFGILGEESIGVQRGIKTSSRPHNLLDSLLYNVDCDLV